MSLLKSATNREKVSTPLIVHPVSLVPTPRSRYGSGRTGRQIVPDSAIDDSGKRNDPAVPPTVARAPPGVSATVHQKYRPTQSAVQYTGCIGTSPLIEPASPEELAQRLAESHAARRSVRIGGHFTKDRMAGPLVDDGLTISTRCMNRILMYEPADLTISVEAGITYRELSQTLASKRQMIPLDPPFAEDATIGGIIAANCSGPRRRLYGTARDMVIGMTFATMEGKLVQTGGMVVKNVAGLDMGKLMIGSFGTLAAIAIVNFKLHPVPHNTRTFVWSFNNGADAIRMRDAVLKGLLQPAAIDILKTDGEYQLLIQAGGNSSMLDRYSRELRDSDILEGEAEAGTWQRVREFVPAFLAQHENAAVVRISCKLTEIGPVLESLPGPALARAGAGVIYACFANAVEAIGRGVIEFAPQTFRETQDLWHTPGDDFDLMKQIKAMLDPHGLLNTGRLYGRI